MPAGQLLHQRNNSRNTKPLISAPAGWGNLRSPHQAGPGGQLMLLSAEQNARRRRKRPRPRRRTVKSLTPPDARVLPSGEKRTGSTGPSCPRASSLGLLSAMFHRCTMPSWPALARILPFGGGRTGRSGRPRGRAQNCVRLPLAMSKREMVQLPPQWAAARIRPSGEALMLDVWRWGMDDFGLPDSTSHSMSAEPA